MSGEGAPGCGEGGWLLLKGYPQSCGRLACSGKTVWDPRNQDGAASFSYRSACSPFKAVTLSLLEPSEVWTMERESAVGRPASSPRSSPSRLEPPGTSFGFGAWNSAKEIGWLHSMLEQPFGSKSRGAPAWPLSLLPRPAHLRYRRAFGSARRVLSAPDAIPELTLPGPAS